MEEEKTKLHHLLRETDSRPDRCTNRRTHRLTYFFTQNQINNELSVILGEYWLHIFFSRMIELLVDTQWSELKTKNKNTNK